MQSKRKMLVTTCEDSSVRTEYLFPLVNENCFATVIYDNE